MHTVFGGRRRLLTYFGASLPLAAGLAALLARGPHALPPRSALGLSLPLALLALALLLPVGYLCRTLPVGRVPLSRLLATHGLAALAASLAWAWLGDQVTQFLVSIRPEAGLLALYRLHAPSLLAVGALLYLLAASFHYTLLAVAATERAEQQSLELAVLAREAEIKALKAQVHPHFLFNSLNSISALTASDPARAREMCVLLSEFFRMTLAQGEKRSVTLVEELAVARTYLAVEALRLGARLSVEEGIDEGAKTCLVPPLLLQPLVENAIRHGIATCAEGGVLRLCARTEGHTLRLHVENPFDPDAPARPGVGLGLSNVQKRLQARYGDKALLDAERTPGLFRVTLLLPAQVHE